MPDDPTNVGKVFQHSVKNMRAHRQRGVPNMNPTTAQARIRETESVFAGSIGCNRMQSFMALASAKNGRYCRRSQRLARCYFRRITPFIFNSSIARWSSFSAASESSIGIEAKALEARRMFVAD